MKKKTAIIFLSLMLVLTASLTGCGRDDKDVITDDSDTKTEDEKIGDSGNLNQGVIEEGEEGVVGDATDAGEATKDDDKSNE